MIKSEKRNTMWILYAIGSAVFAALTSILAKIGIENINSNLATAIRTVVVLILAWGIVFFTGAHTGIGNISQRSFLFLILSGLATGLSWLCYYKAIQRGPVSKVAPIDKFSVVLTIALAFIFLHEKIDVKAMVGGLLITAGTFVLIL
jgi:transporter family protein